MARTKKPAEPKEIIAVEDLDNYKDDFGEMFTLGKLLSRYYVTFTFYKKDGTLRKAIGTKQSDKLYEVNAPIPIGNGASALTFFDLEDLHWKSISYNRYNRPRVEILDTYETLEDVIDECSRDFHLERLRGEV
jgi:hypothetical protein